MGMNWIIKIVVSGWIIVIIKRERERRKRKIVVYFAHLVNTLLLIFVILNIYLLLKNHQNIKRVAVFFLILF